MTMSSQNSDFHWVNHKMVKNRVIGNHLDSTKPAANIIRAGARTLIGGGGCIFIYSGSARLVSFVIKLISKEISRA